MYEGGAYCRWGDPTLQSHFWMQGDLEKPKQLSQMAFYWLERQERLERHLVADFRLASLP